MLYIALPDTKKRRLTFYLAMEEHIAHTINCEDCFFMWQVEPTVIFGRNQLIDNEVNLEYCSKHGIATYRRKSGGGCVYADMSNIMFSYITKDENVSFTFNKYINLIVLMLLKMGIQATATGRNDILIDGRKVSGNAFYHIPGKNIVHGTMLYDTNMEHMVGAITPSDGKLVSKGVKSVRQHIALLKDYTDMGIEEFKDFVRQNMCETEITLTTDDISKIEEIEQEYLSEEFIYGRNPKYTVTRKRRIEGVGDFDIRMELKNNVIKNINIMGDYFLTGDIDKRILEPLKGVPLEEKAVSAALPDCLDEIIMNLKKDDFVKMLVGTD